jgi:hypothetical protein
LAGLELVLEDRVLLRTWLDIRSMKTDMKVGPLCQNPGVWSIIA